MVSNARTKQTGSAIFMALLVVGIATTISIVWFSQIQISVRRTHQLVTSQQIFLYADGVVAWAVGELKKDTSTFPKILPPTKLANVLISGRIDTFPLPQSEIDATQKTMQGSDLLVQASQAPMVATPVVPSMGASSKQAQAAINGAGYFLVRSEVKIGEQYLVLYSVLHLKTVNGKNDVEIISQSRGAV